MRAVKLWSDRQGSVSVIAVFFLAVMTVMAAVGLESAHLYVVKLKSQRVADLAALAAANTATPIVNNAVSATATATALNVASINGFGGSTVVTSVAASPTNDGNQALSTTISQNVPLLFGALLRKTTTSVAATSIVEINPSNVGPCVTSISPALGTGVLFSANVQGPNCLLSAKALLWVDTASKLSMKKILIGTSSSSEASWINFSSPGAISPPPGAFVYNATITDPLAGNASITAIASHLGAMSSWPYGTSGPISIPTVTSVTINSYPGGPSTFTSSGSSDPNCVSPRVLGSFMLMGTNTITLSSGCYIINSITQLNGSTTFAIAPGAKVNILVTLGITNFGGSLAFGDATYAVNGQVTNNGTSISFGNGFKEFVGGLYNGSGTVTLGNGPIYFWGGPVSNAISGRMTFGNGPYYFYVSALTNNGTAVFGNGPYYFYTGGINTGSGSTTVFGTGTMDLYGASINLYGDTTFGSGGSATAGSSMISFAGGSLILWSGNLTAVGVTFALSSGFVQFNGTGAIRLTAPTDSMPTYGYQNLLFYVAGYLMPTGTPNQMMTGVGGIFNVLLTGGGTNIFSGTIYVPGSLATMQGAQTVSPAAGGCLQVIAGVISFAYGITANLAPCMTGSSPLSTVAIVQ